MVDNPSVASGLLEIVIIIGISTGIVAIGYYIDRVLDKLTGVDEQRKKQSKDQEEFLSLLQHDQNKKLINDIHAWVKGDHLERASQFMTDNYPYWRLAPNRNTLNEWITMSVQMTKD